jgi:transporter family-2 protein
MAQVVSGGRPVQLLALLMAVASGVSVGTQPLLNGALGRSRGVLEAVFVSVSVSYVAIVLLLVGKVARTGQIGLPFTATSWALVVIAGAVGASALIVATPGLSAWYYTAGLLGLVILFVGAFFTPILGVGATAAAVVAGQLGASVIWDQLGVLGLPQVAFSPQRALGMLLIIAGVILVRGL